MAQHLDIRNLMCRHPHPWSVEESTALGTRIRDRDGDPVCVIRPVDAVGVMRHAQLAELICRAVNNYPPAMPNPALAEKWKLGGANGLAAELAKRSHGPCPRCGGPTLALSLMENTCATCGHVVDLPSQLVGKVKPKGKSAQQLEAELAAEVEGLKCL